MLNTKVWWQSKTVWASIVAVLAGIATLAGVNLDATLQDELVTLITGAANLAAGLTAWLGRVQAQTTITWSQK